MMLCFLYMKWSSLLPEAVFPFLLSLTTFKWTLAHGFSCNFAGFIMWNWNHNHKVMGSLPAVTDTPCKDSLYDEQDWHTDDVFFKRLAHLKTTELEVGLIDINHPICMNWLILDTVLFSMDRHLHSTWRTTNIVTRRLHSALKWKQFVVGEALPCEQALLFLHSLFVCHVFCLRVF